MALKFSGAIKELRIHLCQTDKASKGVRDWISKNYVGVKKENPHFPILIRECNGIQPRIWARYEKGVERSTAVTNKSAEDVFTAIRQLVK